MDNDIVYSKTWTEHLEHLKQVFEQLENVNLTVKAYKCQFGMRECVYLGRDMVNCSVKPEASKLEDVSSFPDPKTKKQARSI